MSAMPSTRLEAGGVVYKYRAEAAAGVHLRDGTRWWGTRLTYWLEGKSKHEHVTIVDTHPFDTAELELALPQWVTTGKAALT